MPTILTMLPLKIIFISTTIISIAISLKFYPPPITNIPISLPSLYNNIISLLKPPYLYLLINFIILTIFTSSKSFVQVQPLPHMDDVFKYNSINDVVLLKPLLPQFVDTEFIVDTGVVTEEVTEGKIDVKLSTEFVISKTEWSTPVSKRGMVVGKENLIGAAEKLPAATRFGHHRRNVKSSPEGGKTVLGVSKPRKHDTLETTWKTITEGRAMPLTRHLKKSDTWETHGRHHHNHLDNEVHKMKKSETFSERDKIIQTHTPEKLKKEPSLSQDELNKRVEAFIKKFNEDMRLQRQESLNQYKEIINRGAR